MALRWVLGEAADAGSEQIRTSAQKRDAPFFVCGSDEEI